MGETKEPAAEVLAISGANHPPAAPGTIVRHFGYNLTVQEDGSRHGVVPGYAVATELASGRMVRPADLPPAPPPAAPAAAAEGSPPVTVAAMLPAELGLTPELGESLAQAGFGTVQALAAAEPEAVAKAKGIGRAKAAQLIVRASELLAPHDPDESGGATPKA